MPNNPEDLETPQITQNPLDLTSINNSTASTTSQSQSPPNKPNVYTSTTELKEALFADFSEESKNAVW